MGWFDEQIRQRMQSDQEVLEDTFAQMMGAVLDEWDVERIQDQRIFTSKAMDQIFVYFHEKPVKIPENVEGIEHQLEYILRPSGLMTRVVRLEDKWYTDAYGPMLTLMKDTGAVVALMPGRVLGYWYSDPATGKKTRVNQKTAQLFNREALCFYRPLPQKPLKVTDLLWYMRRCISSSDLTLIVLATLAVTLIGFIEPKVYAFLTGTVLQEKRISLLLGIGVFLLAAAFASQMMNMIKNLLMQRISTKTSQAVQASVMMRILALPVSFFRKFSSGDLAERAGSVEDLCTTMLNAILSTGLTSLISLLYVLQIFEFAPSLVLPSLAVVLATIVLSVVTSLMQVGITRQKMQLEAQETGMSYAMLNGIQKIRLSGSEKRAFARWGRLYASSAKLEYNPPMFLKIGDVITTGIGLVGTVVLYYIAVQSGVSGSEYIAFNAAYGRVTGAFTALVSIATTVASIRPILEMAEPILKAEPEVSSWKESVTEVSGAIEMSHVTFRYDQNTPYVLEDLSLKIQPGEYVAVVGRTGCGKSTLVRLLLGFEKPEKGAILYGNHDLSAVDPRSLRKHIGVVIQNGQLFQGDIYSNIAISAPELTLQEAWDAAETAGLADDIREMPMGMQTVISEGQGGISGGQKQRLMIARAIAPKPKILIFDEATSALDNKTQKKVSDALDELKCTRLIIAHRLSTIRHCDRILVMDHGAIIEEGNYEQLIRQKGLFADLVARQRLDVDAE